MKTLRLAKRLPWGALFVLAACARVQAPQTAQVSDANFGIPQELANKFVVSDDKQIQVPIVPATEDAAIEELATNTKNAKAKKDAKVDAKTTVAKRGAKVAIPNRWTMAQPWREGERVLFDITYFGTTAGTAELTVQPSKYIGDRAVFHVRGYAQSTSIFALFYRLNDIAESFIDKEGLFSHKFVIKLDESLQQRDLIELYDQQKHKMYFWSRLDHKKKGKSSEQFEKDISEYTQDVVSALYYLRTLPLEVGKTFHFPVVSNGSPWDVEAEVVRREELVTKAGTFQAFVVKPQTKFEGVLKTTGDSYIWISDDPHRVLLKIDAKVKIGSVIAYLRELDYGKP